MKMKIPHILFLTTIYAALTVGAAYAASNPQQKTEESSANTSSERSLDAPRSASTEGAMRPPGALSGRQKNRSHAPNTNHARSYTSVAKANRPKQFPNSRGRVTVGAPRNLNQAAPNAAVARAGLLQNKTVNIDLAVRSPSLFPSSSASLDTVRHRGSNPAVVGGAANSGSVNNLSANSKTSNTGAINGTLMKRRP